MRYPDMLFFRPSSSTTSVRLAVVLFALIGVAPVPATGQSIPLLTGRIEVDLPNGALKSDVCLSGVPLRGDSLTLVLNDHLAVERISGVWHSPVAVEEEPGGVAKRYTYAGASARPGPTGAPVTDVCLTYAGVFPVYWTESGEYREEDASSVVAFNGRTLRARGVSRWHPTVYDPVTNLTAEALEFGVEVDCASCATLLVNGGRPTPGPVASFESRGVRELLLVGGDLGVVQHGEITFVGEDGPAGAGARFARSVDQIREFLEEFTGTPYGPPPDVIGLTPVRAPRQGQLWGFYSDPGLVLIGMTVPELADALAQPYSKQAVLGFLAHELAHRYFGWTLGAGSPQRDLFGEPFAIYLELKAVRHFVGEEAYRLEVDRLSRQVSGSQWLTSLDEATANDFAEMAYRYAYSPAMLFSLEERIGEPAMREAIARMLSAPAEERYYADFGFLARAVRLAGVDEEVWESWKMNCLHAEAGECLPIR